MKKVKQSPELSQAVRQFLSGLEPEKTKTANLYLSHFIRWFGPKLLVSRLSPAEITKYCQQQSVSDTEASHKLECLRSFLRFANTQAWTSKNLASCVKVRKGKTALMGQSRPSTTISLTSEGHAALTSELEVLKKKRPKVVEAVSLAAADKDFKENSPLDAAKEELGYVDGRIRELEETLKVATINCANGNNSHTICLGDNVILKDNASGEVVNYVIVSTREANPLKDKISDSSPIGKALIGKKTGDVVNITTPAGSLCYVVEKIER